jgi:hypothetical protein
MGGWQRCSSTAHVCFLLILLLLCRFSKLKCYSALYVSSISLRFLLSLTRYLLAHANQRLHPKPSSLEDLVCWQLAVKFQSYLLWKASSGLPFIRV